MIRALMLAALLLSLAVPAWTQTVANPIPVGLAVATTTNVALFGEEQVNGAKIAEAYFNAQGGVNGTPIKLVVQDTAGDEAGAINAFQSLITAKAVAISAPPSPSRPSPPTLWPRGPRCPLWDPPTPPRAFPRSANSSAASQRP